MFSPDDGVECGHGPGRCNASWPAQSTHSPGPEPLRGVEPAGGPGATAFSACQLNPFRRPPVDQVLRTYLYPFETLDPIMTQGALEAEYVVQVFSGLTGLNEKAEVVLIWPKWQVSPDGLTYTFSLRKGARFHDGREVRAADVKYSLERAANPASKSPVAATYLGDIAGVTDRLQGTTSEVGASKCATT